MSRIARLINYIVHEFAGQKPQITHSSGSKIILFKNTHVLNKRYLHYWKYCFKSGKLAIKNVNKEPGLQNIYFLTYWYTKCKNVSVDGQIYFDSRKGTKFVQIRCSRKSKNLFMFVFILD